MIILTSYFLHTQNFLHTVFGYLCQKCILEAAIQKCSVKKLFWKINQFLNKVMYCLPAVLEQLPRTDFSSIWSIILQCIYVHLQYSNSWYSSNLIVGICSCCRRLLLTIKKIRPPFKGFTLGPYKFLSVYDFANKNFHEITTRYHSNNTNKVINMRLF